MSMSLDDSNTEKLNYNFFKKIDTKEKAYVLGYWVADGYISKYKDNHYVVGFSSNDLDLLENIRTHFNDFSGKHISKCKERNYRYRICSFPLYNQLENLGFDNKKSYTAIYPKIPKKFNSHFIRGVLDGDGCIYISKQNYVTLQFSGTEALLSEISKYVNGGKLAKDNETYSCYRLRIHGKKAIPELNYIYKDSENLRLERKYKKYQKALILYKDK